MSDLQLKSIIERILRLHAEEDELKADRREVYAEAKANGYDKTALGDAVRIIRKREKDAAGFEERNAIVDLYLLAFDGSYDGASHVRAYAHTRGDQSNTSLDLSPAAQNEGAAGASPEQEASDSADGGGSHVPAAQGAEFVTQAGAEEGVPAPIEPAPVADPKPVARPKSAPIDLTIPAFLDRRGSASTPRPEAS